MRARSTALLAALLAIAAPRAGAVDLLLRPVPMAYGRFTFEKIDDVILEETPAGDVEIAKATRDFRIWLYREEITQVTGGGYFRYEVYVREKTVPPQPVTKFVFQGTPEGLFDDQHVDVTFEVTGGNIVETGTIRLPIFGKVAKDAVSTPVSVQEPKEVFMAAESTIDVPLTNELQAMDVQLFPAVVEPVDKSLWKAWNAETPNPALGPQEKATDGVKIRLLPKRAAAFRSAWTPGGANDDVVKVLVTYQINGRRKQKLHVSIPVRFKPRPEALLVSTVIGAVLGTIVPQAKRRRKFREFLRIILTTCIVALVVEIVAMLVVVANSQFKLFGLDLDPFQIPSAAVIGVLVGLAGFRSVKALSRIPLFNDWLKGAAPSNV